MYKKPNKQPYSDSKFATLKDKNNRLIKMSNFLLGKLEYEYYIIRIFTMGEESDNIKEVIPYLLLTKDSNDNNTHKINCISIIKPEYIDIGLSFNSFKLNKKESKDLYDFLCSYNYENTFPLFVKKYSDTNYTQFSNYINFINYKNEYEEDYNEIPLDTACPKYSESMETNKIV
jgi:hypothetical protein